MKPIYFFLILALALGGCIPTAAPTPEPPVTPKMVMEATCTLDIRAMAWIDVNANGVQDKGEPPLPGVRFRKAGEDYWSEVSDESGYVDVIFMFGGDPIPRESLSSGLSCDLATDRVLATGMLKNGHPFDVEPEIQSGYRLTTDGKDYNFGFAPLDSTALPSLVPTTIPTQPAPTTTNTPGPTATPPSYGYSK